MGPLARLRRGLALATLLAVAGPGPAVLADELPVRLVPATGGIVVHDAAETLRDWCRLDDAGTLWLVLPGGARFELVQSTADSVLTNPGDGAFHPFDAFEVRTALGAVRYPLEGVAAEVFILPYPRREGLSSAAGAGLVLLSPGVLPLPPEQQHSQFVHELGHVVQRAILPDQATADWDRYRTLRGIADTRVYFDGALHLNRPHEIFAEDFRALFGGALATATGNIENGSLTPPAQVAGLEDFLLQLSGAVPNGGLAALPNPARGSVRFARNRPIAVPLDVVDAAGRHVTTLAPEVASGWTRWNWDGRDAAGRRVGPGVVFVRARDGSASARVILLP